MITFRRVVDADFPLIGQWLSHPHVARWWNQDSSAAAVERDFGPVARGEEPAQDLLAFEDGAPFALVQRCRWADYPEDLAAIAAYIDMPPEATTIDYLIGEVSEIHRGRGTRLIAAFAEDTFRAYPSSNSIIVPVVAGNRQSWRALEKAGFRRIGEAQLDADNPIDPPLHYVQRLDRV
ncbi:MAG: GNAT family N-acetyltransferase [Rhodococcus fascians]|uniref:GNAT family N-acetyltransferase n=1 Tax=Rhodococcoides fascians TaxID=1828 RepID=UPI000565541E|nr:GNAT family N-acetyltransferase [Rhodococcus fascians]